MKSGILPLEKEKETVSFSEVCVAIAGLLVCLDRIAHWYWTTKPWWVNGKSHKATNNVAESEKKE